MKQLTMGIVILALFMLIKADNVVGQENSTRNGTIPKWISRLPMSLQPLYFNNTCSNELITLEVEVEKTAEQFNLKFPLPHRKHPKIVKSVLTVQLIGLKGARRLKNHTAFADIRPGDYRVSYATIPSSVMRVGRGVLLFEFDITEIYQTYTKTELNAADFQIRLWHRLRPRKPAKYLNGRTLSAEVNNCLPFSKPKTSPGHHLSKSSSKSPRSRRGRKFLKSSKSARGGARRKKSRKVRTQSKTMAPSKSN
ncbi:hypothetical protein CDAR_509251 [Caerostris darwini]|uniref:Uncharacterized protein n=1 Tax=Caerostris darwini TaxID=1538125 RepID=A0AAV4N2M4_9ARAC|nr:hypothetical protein CDAR_509251 [Caerostris darwini]